MNQILQIIGPDVLRIVVGYLTGPDIARLADTCRIFRSIIQNMIPEGLTIDLDIIRHVFETGDVYILKYTPELYINMQDLFRIIEIRPETSTTVLWIFMKLAKSNLHVRYLLDMIRGEFTLDFDRSKKTSFVVKYNVTVFYICVVFRQYDYLWKYWRYLELYDNIDSNTFFRLRDMVDPSYIPVFDANIIEIFSESDRNDEFADFIYLKSTRYRTSFPEPYI